MATEIGIYDAIFEANADLSDYQYRIMAIRGERECGLAGAADEDSCGVLQGIPDEEGMAAEVRRVGRTKIVGGAAFGAGAKLTSDGVGRAVEAQAGERYVAVAITAGAEGRISTAEMEFGCICEES